MKSLRYLTAPFLLGVLTGTVGIAQTPVEALTLAEALALIEATETAAAFCTSASRPRKG